MSNQDSGCDAMAMHAITLATPIFGSHVQHEQGIAVSQLAPSAAVVQSK